ncbi:hypothetical protein DVB69_06315 [Sporosarcina sp. BI001-red]|nr:hypothetical protein DVB69_06315 [Sporosarcina sp. BI001-red]
MEIKAYLVNDYYVFTSYNELSTHIYDVVHYTTLEQKGSHLFSVIKGEVFWDQSIFVSDHGKEFPIKYEREYDLYYSVEAMSV